MAVERRLVCEVRVIDADEWIAGPQYRRDEWWNKLRTRWHHQVRGGRWKLLEEPQETISLDKEHAEVRLDIRALGERERLARAPGEWWPP